jgi:long-chain acyl-CoA synthetase
MMNELTDRLAAALTDMGISKGDRVGILMPNTPQFVIAFYGILKAGAVVVATNPLYTPAEIVHQVNDAGVQVMFVMEDLYRSIKTALPRTQIQRLVVAGPSDGLASADGSSGRENGWAGDEIRLRDLLDQSAGNRRARIDVRAADTALFQYSGGTTGTSKAAVASHRGVVANTIQFQAWLVGLEMGKEVFLMAIPLYHAYGMIAGMSLGIAVGATLALVPNARDLGFLLDAIHRHHPTVFPGVPSLYNAINHHPDVESGTADLRSIRVCISGSTALLRETKDRFEALSGGKICEGYGLSEAPVVTHCNPLRGVNKIGSIGMPMPDVDCKIVSTEDAEQAVEPGGSGELILRGPQVMTGYHNMPEETANSLRTLRDGHTWLFTGDIVRMDMDGYFFIVDRKKELIKPGGFQVWPREVEEVIASHPKVLEVGVAGVPDPERGEAVKAWIVVRTGEKLAPDELNEWCRQRIAPYKIPTQYEFRSELPRTNVGKVLRRELVRQHIEADAAHK